MQELSNERHVDSMELVRIAKTVGVLTALGRTTNLALKDVSDAFGLTRADVLALIRLISVGK